MDGRPDREGETSGGEGRRSLLSVRDEQQERQAERGGASGQRDQPADDLGDGDLSLHCAEEGTESRPTSQAAELPRPVNNFRNPRRRCWYRSR